MDTVKIVSRGSTAGSGKKSKKAKGSRNQQKKKKKGGKLKGKMKYDQSTFNRRKSHIPPDFYLGAHEQEQGTFSPALVRQTMILFFAEYAPEKEHLDDILDLLLWYLSKKGLPALNAKLKRKYGADLDSVEVVELDEIGFDTEFDDDQNPPPPPADGEGNDGNDDGAPPPPPPGDDAYGEPDDFMPPPPEDPDDDAPPPPPVDSLQGNHVPKAPRWDSDSEDEDHEKDEQEAASFKAGMKKREKRMSMFQKMKRTARKSVFSGRF